VGALIRVANVAPEQVRVELRCGDICVPEQFLDHAKVGASIKEVRSERVSQRVRVNLRSKTSDTRGGPNRRPRRLTAKTSATTCQQQRGWLSGCGAASSRSASVRHTPYIKICAYSISRRLSDRDHSFTAPLPEESHRPLSEINPVKIQIHNLADSAP